MLCVIGVRPRHLFAYEGGRLPANLGDVSFLASKKQSVKEVNKPRGPTNASTFNLYRFGDYKESIGQGRVGERGDSRTHHSDDKL